MTQQSNLAAINEGSTHELFLEEGFSFPANHALVMATKKISVLFRVRDGAPTIIACGIVSDEDGGRVVGAYKFFGSILSNNLEQEIMRRHQGAMLLMAAKQVSVKEAA